MSGLYTLSQIATDKHEDAREIVKEFINAESSKEIIFVRGATEAINLVAFSWARANLSKDDIVVLTEMEHHADIVPWQQLSKEIGIEVRYVPIDIETFKLDMEAFSIAIIDASLVCVVHTSNVLGVRNPVEEIIQLSHSVGAKVLLDCAQSAPHEKINTDILGADFIAISVHNTT